MSSLHTIDVAATIANLGSGFDTLAVAVQLFLRVRIVAVHDDGKGQLTVLNATPAVQGDDRVRRGFEALARRSERQSPSVSVEVESDIPIAAGLGSSAAATVAGMRVFETVTSAAPDDDLLTAAAALEGHAENAAAALHGGFVSVVEREDRAPLVLRWQWPDDLRIVIATPSESLPTPAARAALPGVVSRQDAVFNLQRALSFVHALQSGDAHRLCDAIRDRWHQPARAALVSHLAAALKLIDAEGLPAFLAGAGPSVAVLAWRDIARTQQLLRSACDDAGCPVVVRTVSVHHAASGRTQATSVVERTS